MTTSQLCDSFVTRPEKKITQRTRQILFEVIYYRARPLGPRLFYFHRGMLLAVTTPTLSDLERLAREAGEILRQGYSARPGNERRVQVKYKSEIDPVTEFDHRSEAFLVGEIRRLFPDHRILAEESGVTAGGEDCQWYIDPLDGTVNYAHGVPVFSVSIAYAHRGVLQLGVVYDPIQDECFSAESGLGAWLNGEPLQVSTTETLNSSLLATGFPYDIRHSAQNNLDHYKNFSLQSQGVRRLGSASLDLCYVAAGRFDGYWEIRLQPWDMAAGALIAAEAGAKVTDLSGRPNFLSPPCSILAANSVLHTQMLTVLNRSQE